MTINVANTANNNTFDYWRNRTNELAYAMSTYAVTTDSNIAAGNSSISGTFNANSVITNTLSVNSAVTFGNTTVNTYINSTFISTGNASVNSFVNTSALSTYNIYVGSNLVVNTTTFYVGNSTANGTLVFDTLYLRSNSTSSALVNTSSFVISNGGSSASLSPYNLTLGTTVISNSNITTGTGGFTANTSSAKVGSNVIVDTSSLNIGNSTVNSVHTSLIVSLQSNSTTNSVVNSTIVQISNSISTANLSTVALSLGNSITNTIITSSSLNVNENFIANSSGVFSTLAINSPSFAVGTSTTSNSTGVYTGIVNGSTIQVGSLFTANSTLVNAVAVNVTNRVNTSSLYASGTANVGANVQISTLGVGIAGNTTTQPTLNLVSSSTSSGLFIGNGSVTGAPQVVLSNSAGTTTINCNAIDSSWGFSVNSSSTIIPGTLTASINATSVSVGNSTVNTYVNSTFISTGNSSVNTFITATTISVNGSLSAKTTASIGGNATLSGSWANVTGDMFVRGNLSVNGSVTYTGTAVGDIIPPSNNYSLGNTSNRWSLYSVQIDNLTGLSSNNITVTNIVNAASFTVGTSAVQNTTGFWTTGTVNTAIVQLGNGYNVVGNGVYANSTLIWIGNNSVSASINATNFSKTANNTLYVGSTAAAAVVNSAQLSSNLSNYAALSGATFTGAVTVSNDASISGNLTVSGTSFFANVTTFDVKDTNITVAKGVSTAAAANGSGITVDTVNAGWYYHNGTTSWQSNLSITPYSNVSFDFGTTALRWANVYANTVVSTNLYGTIQTATQGTINHDSLANFNSNKHIDHTTVSISAGDGLSGGGTIASNRTLSVLANTGVISNSSGVFTDPSYVKGLVNVSNNVVVVTTLSTSNIDSFAKSSYMGAEYLINVNDNSANNKYVSKILVMHDGSSAQITEYASITSNSAVGTFSATQNSTHIILQFTPVLNSTTVKFTRMVV